MTLFLILAPFATFATLMMLSTVSASLAAAAAVALGVVGWDQFKGRSAKLLSIGTLVLFAALGACHALTDGGMSPAAVRIAVDGGFLSVTEEAVRILVENAELESEIEAQFRTVWCAPLDDSPVEDERIAVDGPPADAIVALARDADADVIVVGERGSGGGRHGDLGSTSHRVLAIADRPVLVVPEVAAT